MKICETGEIKKRPKPKIGNFFILNLTDMDGLIQRGIQPEEFHAFLVLAAATDEGNTNSRAGRKAIATARACSMRTADALIKSLIQRRAIESLEGQMENIRNPTSPRFRLLQSVPKDPASESTFGENFVAISNDLPRNPNFRQAVDLAGIPAIKALFELSRDPCGSQWPSRLSVEVNSLELMKLGDHSLHDLPRHAIEQAVSKLSQLYSTGILALADFDLVCFDLYAAVPNSAGQLKATDPIASLEHGLISQSGPFAEVANAVRRLKVRSQLEPLASPGETIHSWHPECLRALLPNRFPAKKIILKPRLKILPGDTETIAQEAKLWADGKAAAERVKTISMNLQPEWIFEECSPPKKGVS